jgi:hypothetical protein
MSLDLEGLQVAYLGVALAHYLDLETGDIVDVALDDEPPGDASRFLRIPTRTPESEAEDRSLFVERMDARSPMRGELAQLVDDPQGFRAKLAEDIYVQKKFFNFKNDQATRAIRAWLDEEGISE